jgi:hypothetical protein
MCLIRHKWLVMRGCVKAGLYRQGLTHDLSKFSRAEFQPYAWKFFPPDDGFVDSRRIENAFLHAWLHHQHRNRHHWNYWVVDQSEPRALPMPDNYLVEMVCDWRAVGRQLGNTAREYYEKNRRRIILHPETRKKLERMLLGGNQGDTP